MDLRKVIKNKKANDRIVLFKELTDKQIEETIKKEEEFANELPSIKRIKVMVPDNTTIKEPTDGSAGLDLPVRKTEFFRPGQQRVISTGLRVLIPPGYCGKTYGRSKATKKRWITRTGIIDAGYTGELYITIKNGKDKTRQLKKGETISQLVITPILEPRIEIVDSMPKTLRGERGIMSQNTNYLSESSTDSETMY